MQTPLIEFRNVSKRFGSLVVLDRINLKIYEGEVTTIIGLSGAGKSVLLRHIIGLLKPDEGEIYFRGKALSGMKQRELDQSFATMSYMFQGNALFDSMSVFENVALPLKETTDLKKSEIEQRVMMRIDQMELGEAANSFPSELSGGMQKRVALARALVTNPQIVLFDEPTSGQDPVRKNAILSMIAEYQHKFNFTAVLVSHAIPDVYFISNRILAIFERSIVFQGTPEEFENFDHPFKNEVLHSLEELQRELTGLYSRRQFKLQYRLELSRPLFQENYVMIVFTIDNLEDLISQSGHEAAQETIHKLGVLIDKHFGAVGGFSTRRGFNEFVTVLPYSNIEESEGILRKLIEDFQARGMSGQYFQKYGDRQACIEFGVSAGMAQGLPIADMEAMIASAEKGRREIARFTCAPEGAAE